MTDTSMIDAVFDISGNHIPNHYPFALWNSLVQRIPALENEALVGVIPLRTAISEAGMLLPKRSKLVLRLTARLAANFACLTDQTLDLGDATLQLGSGKLRKIQPYSTLHAHLVASAKDEVAFLKDVSTQLNELGIVGKLLCGMRNTMQAKDYFISGYSLVIHDLKPDDSLKLQYAGLGADRRYGCGIFIPYKVITDLD
ncbi:MAG: type I-MYXAN CRISPR-associated protein Cas6/Cmx6 [Proteobacteria bacterium]|nr:type I-MYXAN CRISPR-associated protein Cas6/Cmx6 [Pseudomonadota bacterium]